MLLLSRFQGLAEQFDLFRAIGPAVAVEEVVLPDLRLAHPGPPTPGEVGLRFAVDQSPVHAADIGIVERGQAGFDD